MAEQAGMAQEEKPRGPVITIAMLPNGDINVNGPLHDKILCLGMLRIAEHIIIAWKPGPQDQPRIVVPSAVIPRKVN